MIFSTSTASRTLLANTDTQSMDLHAGTMPQMLTRPRVGFNPTIVLNAAGIRPEPAVSVPRERRRQGLPQLQPPIQNSNLRRHTRDSMRLGRDRKANAYRSCRSRTDPSRSCRPGLRRQQEAVQLPERSLWRCRRKRDTPPWLDVPADPCCPLSQTESRITEDCHRILPAGGRSARG